MRNGRRAMRSILLATFSFVFLLGTPTPGSATIGKIVKSDLKGTWQLTLRGRTSCGFSSVLATLTFGTTGVGTGPVTIHGDCGDSTLPNQTFTVTSLAAKGNGKGTLTCGTGCLWTFDFQVAPDRSKFNLAAVKFTDPDTYLAGLAIASSVADNIVLADLKGEWAFSVSGHQFGDCVGQPFRLAAAGTLTLDHAGNGNVGVTLKTNCGSFEDPLNPITVLTLNPDGGGTARLECGGDCEITFNIQVSADRSMMNLVSVSTGDPDDMLAGVAVRRSTGGHIVKANAAGPWQGAVFVEELDGDLAAVLITFTLNAKGETTNLKLVAHDTEGDGIITDGSATVTINPDGSGTLSDGETTLRLQVSPDRSVMSIVGVDPATEDLLVGVLIHQ